MDERVLRFRVGVVVVAAAIITIILITLLGAWPSPFKPRYTLHIVFPEAPGVTIDTPVRKSGIQIGRVSDVELKESGDVILTLKIDAKYPLRANEFCRITTGSLVTGDAILEFTRSDNPSLGTNILTDGEYLTNGTVESNPFQVLANMQDEIASTLNSIEGAGNEVTTLARSMNTLVGSKEEELASIVDKTATALDSFNKAMLSIDSILGDTELKGKLRQSIEQVPDLLTQFKTTLSDFQTTLTKFNAVAARAEVNLANLEDFTAPLGERGEEISQNLSESIRHVNELLANAAELSEALRNKDGTIGQLINNPELYERLNQTLAEVELSVRKIQPILNDARIFTDKIARDPSQLGVKGALDKRYPGMGQKWPTPPLNTAPPRR